MDSYAQNDTEEFLKYFFAVFLQKFKLLIFKENFFAVWMCILLEPASLLVWTLVNSLFSTKLSTDFVDS